MKLNIIIIFLCINYLSFAQLSVKGDHFVFVNDEIVFVEKDIKLNDANSMMYLRNDAQLIQGDEAERNSGIGQISVNQNGNVGVHEYNYWCSPVGNTDADNNTNSAFRPNNNIYFVDDSSNPILSDFATYTTGHNGSAVLYSSLEISSRWLYTYKSGTDYSDWNYIGDTGTVDSGYGFTMKGTDVNNQNYDFRGKPNSGTIEVDVDSGKQTLTGNPYPSAMDAAAYIHDPENLLAITGTLYFWEQDLIEDSHELRAYKGGYSAFTIDVLGNVITNTPATFSTYNGDGTTNVGSVGNGSKQPKRYIPIGQGFMVEGKILSTVKAKNAHRVYIKETHPDSEFFKTANTKTKAKETTDDGFFKVPDDYKRFRLNIDFNNTYTRQLLENFHTSATFGFDYGLESKINEGDILASDAYFSNNNSNYLAEALPFDESLKIPLTIKVTEDMPVRIRIADIQNFDSNLPIYIHDKENNIFINLKNQDFDMNLEAGTYTDRFEVTFNSNTLHVDDAIFNDFNIFQNNTISELKILNPNVLEIKSFRLYDISGKQVITQNISKTKNTYAYSTKSLSDGAYIARISLSNNQGFTKKVIIANK